jgi:hypothetical protein
MPRSLITAAALLAAPFVAAAAFAQTFTPGTATQQVQLLAPQLVAFSGSAGNFESLVNGLTSGAPVTLAAVNSDGSLQIVSFTPGTVATVADTARLLETARQNLITRGIAAPTGPQLAAALLGGTVSGISGPSTLTGVLTGATTPPTQVIVRTDPAAQPGATPTPNISAVQLQALRNALASGNRLTLTSGTGAGTQNTTFVPTGRLSDAEITQALQSAGTLLAQQGIVNPTPDQLRAALFGGTVLAAGATPVAIQGVLQAEVRNTSDSRVLNTSASPASGTSASSSFGTSNTPAQATGPSSGPTRGGTVGSTGSGGRFAAPGR